MRGSETLCLLEPASNISALPVLSPAQSKVCDDLRQALTPESIAILRGTAGLGKTTIIKTLQGCLGGIIIGAKDFLALLMKRAPVAIEETSLELVQTTFETHDTVFLDDFHLMIDVVVSYEA
jgi:predicted AAA+ superfamily ATPase